MTIRIMFDLPNFQVWYNVLPKYMKENEPKIKLLLQKAGQMTGSDWFQRYAIIAKTDTKKKRLVTFASFCKSSTKGNKKYYYAIIQFDSGGDTLSISLVPNGIGEMHKNQSSVYKELEPLVQSYIS